MRKKMEYVLLALVFAAVIQSIFTGFYVTQYHGLLVVAGAVLLAASCMILDRWKKTIFVYGGLIVVLLLLYRNMLINGFRIISNKMADAINQSMDMGFYYYVSVDMDHSREDCVFAVLFFFLCATLLIGVLRLRPLILFVVMGICQCGILIVSPYSITSPFVLFLGAWFAYYNLRKNKVKFGVFMFALMVFVSIPLYFYDQVTVPEETLVKTSALRQIRRLAQGNGYQVTGGIGNGEIGKIGSVSPGGVKLFQVTSKYKDTLFLKGFVSGSYQDGLWEKEEEDSRIFAGEPAMGIPFLYAELEIGNLLEEGMQQELFWEDEEVSIHYQKKNDLYLLMPYFSDVNRVEANQSGDANLFRIHSKKDYQIRSYGMKDTDKLLELDGMMTDAEIASLEDASVEENYFRAMSEYKAYVTQKYLEVPKQQEDAMKKKYGEILQGETLFEKVQKIKKYLQENYQYTYRPGLTPEGKDPILYFLNENKKGFCTQYASAAVMMLRCAGVPARYVEGYKIDKSRWNAKATVQATDYDAHAWAEVFVTNVGWVPVDVTGISTGRNTYETIRRKEKNAQKINVTKDSLLKSVQSIGIFVGGMSVAIAAIFLLKKLRELYLWKQYDNREKVLFYSRQMEKYENNPKKAWKSNEIVDEMVIGIIQKAKYSPYEISDEEMNMVRRHVDILKKQG